MVHPVCTRRTPTSPAPIWLARRILWASPPESVSALRDKDRYSRPTSVRNPSLALISLRIFSAISFR